MTPTLAVQFAAAADGRQVTIDEDVALIQLHNSGSSAGVVVSLDPKSTIANTITSPPNGFDENILAISRGTFVDCGGVPISAGQSVFVSASAAASVVLIFLLTRPS